MSADRSVVQALEAALEGDPGNAALELHLGTLVVDEDPARALKLAQGVLATNPIDASALHLAMRAARGCGDAALGDRYGFLFDSVTGAAGDAEGGDAEPGRVEGGRDEARGGSTAGGESNVVQLRAIDGGISDDSDYELERPRITLSDVGGLDSVKRQLTSSFLAPLRNPELRATFGKSLRGGLLMFGPPGCGKTFLARAVAGEVGARFLGVGLSDVLDMWLGESERKLHEIFELARRSAPCVVFLDEVDALGQKRSNMRHAPATRNVVSQLLAEMDGVAKDNEGVFILAATNHPWDVDPALRRPGRLDRSLIVLPPDEPARVAILATHLEGRPVADNIDLVKVARRTHGFSGADLSAVCESATEIAMNDSIETGHIRPIGNDDLAAAAKTTRPSTRPWFDVAYNYAMFANEGGQYDDLLDYIRKNIRR